MKQKGTFSLKKRQTRIMLYLLMAIIAVIVSFSVAGAWFLDRDKASSPMDMAGAVIVKLVGTGEDGAIQNFKELYDSDGGAYPGDRILDSVKVQMGENTEESVLRVQYSVNILDEEKNVKTENLTEAETNLISMLKNDLETKTTLYSSDWAQTSSDWIYYKHLASGKTKPIDLFDEYSLPLSDAQMDNNYQELSFRISLVAEAIQAANIMSYDEWNTDITNLSDSTLTERIIKYNGERFADVDEVLPYIESTGEQYIDTNFLPTLDTIFEISFNTSTAGKWLFGSRSTGGASDTYGVYLAGGALWFQMANDSSSTNFSASNYMDKQSVVKTSKEAVYLDGTKIGTVGRTSFGESSYSLYIGALHNRSGIDPRTFVGKIYSSKIWDNGKLVRFFVPARDKDGNVGLFDLVTNQMYLNAGTGSFRYGHSINYVTNGGTISENSPKTFVSSDLPITLPTPTREGYEFGGWFLSSDFSGAAQTTIPTGTDNNVYVYAKWIKTYNITYHLGGGENAESNPQTFSEKTLPLTLAAPTREGFTFAGWYQNTTGSGNQVTKIEVGTEKNVSLWAKWDAIEYSVSYVLNGGTNNSQNVTKYTILDTPVKLFNPTYDGYVFEGWFSSSDFSGERVTYLSKTNLANVTLYAKWSLAYTITYNTNGGLNDGRNPSVFTANSETFTLFDATRVNYTFLGWFDNEELSGTAITEIAKGTKNNITLWAKWSSTQIVVTFNPNGGGVSPLTKVVKKGETYEELPTPTKAGYVFDGWFTELDGGTQVLNGSTIISNADHTLYAHWTENVYTVTYNLDGGTNNANNPETFKCSDLPIALLDATKDGEYFAGWYMDASFTKRVTNIDAGSLKNIELWARFSSSPLVFDLVGSSAYSVRAANSSISGAIEIPATYNDKPVVVIQNSGFKNCSNMTAISIPNSIRSIGINAFENCSNIAEVVIPEGVTLIGNNTFLGCVKLASVTLPTSLESIGSNAFAGCSSLTMIALPKNVSEIGKNAFADSTQYGEKIEMTSDFWGGEHYQSRTSHSFGVGAFVDENSETYARIDGYQNDTRADTAWKLEMKSTISVVAGKTYTVGFYIRGNNCQAAQYFRSGEARTGFVWSTGFQSITQTINYTCDGNWHKIEFAAVAPSGATTLKIRIGSDVPDIYGVGSFVEIANFHISSTQSLDTVEVYGDTPATLKTGVFPNSVSKIYVKPSLVSTYKTAWAEYKDKIVGFSQYTITYNLNGGTNNAKNITTFSKVDLPILIFDPTKENADFLGWYKTSDFSGEKVTEITTAENITLYARWDRKMSITYVLNGGSNNAANLTTITESMLPYMIGDAVWGTKTFLGWFDNSNFEGEQIESIKTFGDITIYASWGANYDDLFEFVQVEYGYSIKVKSGASLIGEVIMPSTYNNRDVAEIASSGFSGLSQITSVILPKRLTTIGDKAFQNCSGLTSVTIGSGVTSIGSYAFYGCSRLTSIAIPDSVTSIGEYAFQNCSGLTSVTIGSGVTSIGRYAFQNCSGLTSLTIGSGVTSIGSYAFSGCNGLTKVNIADLAAWFKIEFGSSDANPLYYAHHLYLNNTEMTELTIPSSVTSIKKYALYRASGLTSITIPEGVTSIGEGAFYYCSGLTSITIPNSVTSIGEYAFQNCSGLTSITIPNSVTSIGEYAFYDCSGLTKVNITDLAAWFKIDFGSGGANPLYYAHHLYLNNTEITELTIPSSVTSIKRYALSGTSGLTSITIPESVTSIGEYAFQNCSGLTSITIPNSVTSIGEYAFYDCSGLTSVIIGNGVTSIGESTFSGCGGLTSITIPNSVTRIVRDAFRNCTGLTQIYIPSRVATIYTPYSSYSPFNGCSSSLKIYCGAASKPSGWGNYWNYTGSSYLRVVWGVAGNPQQNSEWEYIEKLDGTIRVEKYIGSATEVAVPSTLLGKTVNKIYDSCFANNETITSVTIPDSVTSIGLYAFQNCSGLTSVTIGSGVTSIGQNAFQNCKGLKQIYIPSSVTTIYAYDSSCSPFYGCNSSLKIYCGAASKPSGWNSYWNYYKSGKTLTVNWGATGLPES